MKISLASLLSLLAAPKSLDQAKGTLSTAATTIEGVAALFSTAGLDMEAMLAAGPDALKAHLASLSAKDGDLATALAKVTDIEGKLSAANTRLTAADSILAAIGAKADTKPTEYAGLLDAHVKTAAASELAKHGHKPVPETPAGGTGGTVLIPGANATRQEHYAYMATLPEKDQSTYFAKNLRTGVAK